MPVHRLNHAVLYVRNTDRSVAFYTDVLGFEVSAVMGERAAFLRSPGSANDHDLGLFAVGPTAPEPLGPQVGLYHLAWEVGTLGELVEIRDALVAHGALVGSSDHSVSKSLYARDPDGIEFEVMWRVPVADWPAGGSAGPPRRLDLDDALARWGADTPTGAAAGSVT